MIDILPDTSGLVQQSTVSSWEAVMQLGGVAEAVQASDWAAALGADPSEA